MRKTKFLCLVLSIVMVLSCVTMASAASFPDVATSKYAEAIETIHSLGVVNGYTDGTYGPNDTLTRAEFATIVINALDYNYGIGQIATDFTDVAANHWASGYIGLANSLGIVAGYGNGKFGPNDVVTYAQAITMVVRALGYDANYFDTHYENVSWPLTYMIVGAKLGLTDKLTITSASQPITRGEMAQIIYNALDEEIVKYNFFGMNTATAGDTMLARLEAKSTQGLITYTDNTTVNVIENVGKYGYTYTNKAGKVIATVPTSSELTGTFKSGKFIVGDTTYTVTSTTAAAFVNAKQIADKALTDWTGTVTLNCEYSGTTISKVYSVCQWTGVDKQLTKSTVFNAKNFTLAGYTFDNNGTTVDEFSYVLNGANALADLAANDMVTVYLYGGTGNIVRVDAASNVISGVVTKISTVKGITYYTINNVDYKSATALTIGSEYKCYLNAEGAIAKAEVINGLQYSDYAVFVGEATETFGDKYIAYYTVSAPTTYTKSYVATGTSLSAGDLFTFTTSNGKINTVTKASTAAAVQWTGYVFTIDGVSYLPADNCAVWAFDGDDYAIVKTASLEKKTELKYGASAQYALKDGRVVAIIVSAAKSSAISSVGYAVINESGVKLNAKNESVNYFNGYIDGAAVTYAETISTSVAVPTTMGVYKANYSGSAIKSFDSVTKTAITCAAVSGNLVGDGTNYYVLEDNAVTYTYDTAYVLGGAVSVGDKAYLYDTDADGLYEIVILY